MNYFFKLWICVDNIYIWIVHCSDEIVPDGNADEAASDYGHYQTTLLEDTTTTCETWWRILKKGAYANNKIITKTF